MAKPENPPAFPVRIESPAGVIDILHGMSLRDWFAGQAVAGFCSMSDPCGTWSWDIRDVAGCAYAVADAMLSARQTTDREDGK
jgi:hypothetical protein